MFHPRDPVTNRSLTDLESLVLESPRQPPVHPAFFSCRTPAKATHSKRERSHSLYVSRSLFPLLLGEDKRNELPARKVRWNYSSMGSRQYSWKFPLFCCQVFIMVLLDGIASMTKQVATDHLPSTTSSGPITAVINFRKSG